VCVCVLCLCVCVCVCVCVFVRVVWVFCVCVCTHWTQFIPCVFVRRRTMRSLLVALLAALLPLWALATDPVVPAVTLTPSGLLVIFLLLVFVEAIVKTGLLNHCVFRISSLGTLLMGMEPQQQVDSVRRAGAGQGIRGQRDPIGCHQHRQYLGHPVQQLPARPHQVHRFPGTHQ
jgi:hypothetical protein